MVFHLAICFSFYFFVHHIIYGSSRCSLFSSCRRYRLFSLLNRLALCSSVCCCRWRLSVSRLLSNLCCRCSSLSRCLNMISVYRLSDRRCKNISKNIVPDSSIDIELRRIKLSGIYSYNVCSAPQCLFVVYTVYCYTVYCSFCT